MNQIIKIFNGTTEADLKGGGIFSAVTWEDLLPAIKKTVVLRDDETIDGFTVSDEGIRIKLSRKKGRKTVAIPVKKKRQAAIKIEHPLI